MSDERSAPKYPVSTDDHSGLQPVPVPGLERVPSGWARQNAWREQQQKEHYSPDVAPTWSAAAPGKAAPPNEPNEPKPRILGLSARVFWIVIIGLVLVVAGAIAGGVGGGLAAQRRADSLSSPASSDTVSSTDPGPSTDPVSSTDTAATKTSRPGTATPTTSRSGVVSPAPTDGGCPNINGSIYTPLDGQGKDIPLRAGGAAQVFTVLCHTNYPAGKTYGNPHLYDIMRLYLPSLEDCIAACAMYNAKYETNLDSHVFPDDTGLCRSVAIVKAPGEYCYLKNGTGTNDTFGYPATFTSAVMLLANT